MNFSRLCYYVVFLHFDVLTPLILQAGALSTNRSGAEKSMSFVMKTSFNFARKRRSIPSP